MEVLAVPVPLQDLFVGILGTTLIHGLADPQPPNGGMPFTLLFIKAADPTTPGTVLPVAAKGVVYLIHQIQGKILEFLVAGVTIEPQVVADGKGVSP